MPGRHEGEAASCSTALGLFSGPTSSTSGHHGRDQGPGGLLSSHQFYSLQQQLVTFLYLVFHFPPSEACSFASSPLGQEDRTGNTAHRQPGLLFTRAGSPGVRPIIFWALNIVTRPWPGSSVGWSIILMHRVAGSIPGQAHTGINQWVHE